jgi:hypothetical protein
MVEPPSPFSVSKAILSITAAAAQHHRYRETRVMS